MQPNTDPAPIVALALILAAVFTISAIFLRYRPAMPEIAPVSIMVPERD